MMLSALSNKRPIQEEEFIDLTNSDDEPTNNRPTKRARSGSFRSTPPDIRPLTLGGTINKSPQKPGKHTDRAGSTGSTRKPVTPTINGFEKVRSAYSKEQSRRTASTPFSDTDRKQSAKSFDRSPSSLSNGFKDQLSIRPSPIRQISITKARSPEVINLDSESDRDVSQYSRKLPQAFKAPSTDIPTADLKLSDWTKPLEAKPIRFDPTVKQSQSNAASRSTSLGHNAANLSAQHGAGSSGLFRDLPQTVRNANSPQKARHVLNSVHLPKTPLVIVPPTEAQLLRRIKDDIGYIRSNPKEVELGLGVARFDDTDLNAATFEKAKQKHRKSIVKRDSISLGLGAASPSKNVKDDGIIEPRSAVRHVLLERFKQSHDAPLSFKNRIDERCLDGKFQFVTRYIWSRRVMKRKQTPLPFRACHCVPTESCQSLCSCATIQAKESGKELKVMPGIRPYERNNNGTIVLSQKLLDLTSHPVIYECTDKCSCGLSCTNKVVQKGRTLSLQIFETGRCGFGVKAMQDIAKGQFIDLYLGEVLTTGEVQRRENAAEEDTPSYIMSLDMFVSDDKSSLHVDGANFGSLTRFVNHSCEPNAKTIPVVLSEDTRHIYHVAFFAIKDIPRHNEITIDYNPDMNDEPVEDEQPQEELVDSAIVQCKCGAANCRKRLWMPGKEKRVRRRYLPDIEDD